MILLAGIIVQYNLTDVMAFSTPPSFGHLPYMANATPEKEIYNPSHSLKFRAIPTDFLLNRDVSRVGNTRE